MTDLNNFTKRLQMLLDYNNLSASSLATKIGIQRSTISHVISGRNKPSLDFVMKILHNFDDVTIEWLIDGNGEFPKKDTSEKNVIHKPLTPTPELFEKDLKKSEHIKVSSTIETKSKKVIDKIIVLYDDGSFDSYLK